MLWERKSLSLPLSLFLSLSVSVFVPVPLLPIFCLFYFGHQALYDIVFQHDNAGPNIAGDTTQFLSSNIQLNLT